MKVEMREIPREDAEVLHKHNLGIQILCTAFVGKSERRYYALGLEDAAPRPRRPRTKGVVSEETLMRLTAEQPSFKSPDSAQAKAYSVVRKHLDSDLKKSAKRGDLVRLVVRSAGLDAKAASNAISVLHRNLGLLTVAEEGETQEKKLRSVK